MLGTGPLDQQDRLADALHNAADQGMDRLDAGHHVDLRRGYRRAPPPISAISETAPTKPPSRVRMAASRRVNDVIPLHFRDGTLKRYQCALAAPLP